MQDVVDLLQRRAAEKPHETQLVWEPLDGEGREWTRAGLLADVQSLAARMDRMGVRQGDKVMLYANNCPELVIAWFACAWLGATSALINPKSTADELAYFAGHLGASGLIWQDGLAARPDPEKLGIPWSLPMSDVLEAEGDRAGNVPGLPAASVDPAAPAFMLFTSGTTSRPKAVIWSRENVAWAASSGSRISTLTAADVALLFVPLYHIVGLAWTLLPALYAGARIVLLPRFSGTHFWRVALKTKATFAAHVQFSTAALARLPVPDFHHFRLWCNSTWLPEYEAYFRVPIVGWWGMTEMVAPGIVGKVGRAQTAGSIGAAAEGYALRIAGTGRDSLGAGDAGELEVKGIRGKTIFSGYYRNPSADDAAFTDDGWFRTGDRVRVHNDGSVQFIERSRDVIKTGGEGVSPAEVERLIRQVPGVSDVAVVGRPDLVMGEVGVAFVVLHYTGMESGPVIEAAQKLCAERLAKFKVPREFRVIDRLPLAGINKVAKGELRRIALIQPVAAPTNGA
ncbi:class I adenylate-forming enzyme family protein [Variovorax sp. VNK109]|uniref:class I adenylate-forming enzyme family protein n=1 Tax=Variovorax sp. VNK109 TaxID=3400919 RepID=UPI003BFD68BA